LTRLPGPGEPGQLASRSKFLTALLAVALLAELAVLVLAEVFAHGVRLREDVERTI
jgi:hypothetical protein